MFEFNVTINTVNSGFIIGGVDFSTEGLYEITPTDVTVRADNTHEAVLKAFLEIGIDMEESVFTAISGDYAWYQGFVYGFLSCEIYDGFGVLTHQPVVLYIEEITDDEMNPDACLKDRHLDRQSRGGMVHRRISLLRSLNASRS